MSENFFGIRKQGEESIYVTDRDFLYVTPELLVKGAAFASSPNSDICKRLEKRSTGGAAKIRETLEYLLTVLHDCRQADLSDVFDASKVDAEVYHAIMEGVGAMVLRKFNRLFRELRFTALTDGKVDEPIRYIDQEAALVRYDELLSGGE